MIDFVLTVLGGGPDSAEIITRGRTVNVRKKIKNLSANDYSSTLKKIKITLLIEGSLTSYDENMSGVHNLRYSPKKEEVSCDSLIKKEDWKPFSNSNQDIDGFLNNFIYETYKKIIDYLSEKSITIDGVNLLSDLKLALGIE